MKRAVNRRPLVKKAARRVTLDLPQEAAPGEIIEDPAIHACEVALKKGLSPAQEANVRQRLELLRECQYNPARQREELERCAKSVAYFAKWYGWGFDPRKTEGSRYEPFIPWAKQLDYFEWIEELRRLKREGSVPKTRGAGATFLSILYAVNRFLFEDDFVAGFGSAKKELVDNAADPKTIFYKIRVVLYRLPLWMMPAGFHHKRNSADRRITNPANGSALVGESGDNIGRGGRTSIYFVDEAAFIARAGLAERSLSENSDVRVWISTPNGVGNVFWQKVHRAMALLFRFHWKDDPRKNHFTLYNPDGTIFAQGNGTPAVHPAGKKLLYEWYEAKKLEESPVTIAQEYDIDFSASLEGVLISAKHLEACLGLNIPRGPWLYVGYDIASQGNNESALVGRYGPVVSFVERWSKVNTTNGARRAIGTAIARGAKWLFYDRGGGYGDATASEMDEALSRGHFQGVSFLDKSGEPILKGKGINGGARASAQEWAGGARAHQKFANKRTELFEKVAERVRRTYEYVFEGIEHDPDSLLSISLDIPEGTRNDLIAQLTMILVEERSDGKAILEPKKSMKKKGIPSPDLADALAYAYEDPPRESLAGSFSTTGRR